MPQDGQPPGTDKALVSGEAPLTVYNKTVEVRWSDCDANGHMRHSAYLDVATHVRFAYLAERGYTAERFHAQGIAPAIVAESLRYLREVRHPETIRVDFNLEAFSDDGARWKVFHTLYKESGKRAAIVQVEGAFLDIKTRKMRTPPRDLFELMKDLPVARVPTYRLLRF
jgi:acyl-CoA thioester hydrolase